MRWLTFRVKDSTEIRDIAKSHCSLRKTSENISEKLFSSIVRKTDIHCGYTFKYNFLSLPWYTQQIGNPVVFNHW